MSYGYQFDPSGIYPAVQCEDTPQPGTLALQAYAVEHRGLTDLGTGYGGCKDTRQNRPPEDGNWLSFHALWLAGDNGGPFDELQAWADELVAGALRLGTQEVIFNRRRWTSKTREWRPFDNGIDPHVTHVHWAICREAAATLTEQAIRAALDPEEDSLPFTEIELRKIVREEADRAIQAFKVETAVAFGVNSFKAALIEASRLGDAKKDD